MRRLVLALLALLPAGCAAPALRTYVLGRPPVDDAPFAAQALPAAVIEVRPVLVPDYLDSRDIQQRQGALLVASPNGRWAERLSVGIRQAFAADLQALLPQAAVVTASPLQPDYRRVELSIGRFELDAAGTLTLDADWTVETTRPAMVLAHKRARLVTTGVASGDPAEVAAMGALLVRLAEPVARDLGSAAAL